MEFTYEVRPHSVRRAAVAPGRDCPQRGSRYGRAALTSDRATGGTPEAWALIGSKIKDDVALEAGRRRLMVAARQCFVTSGYGGTAVSEIADAAGISIGSLYKYVRSKEDLLWLLAEDASACITEALAELDPGVSATDQLLSLIGCLVRTVHDHADLMEIFYLEYKHMPAKCKERVKEQDQALTRRIADTIESGVSRGEFVCAAPYFLAVVIEMMATTWILKRWLLGLDLDTYIVRQQDVACSMLGIGTETQSSCYLGE